MPRAAAIAKLTREHDLDAQAAENVLRYLADQELATEQVPDDRTIVIERVRDELGDWRVCVLTPFGSRVHAPWAMAATAKIKAAGLDVETMWSEDGFVLRFPETDAPPDAEVLLMEPAEAARAGACSSLGRRRCLRRSFARRRRGRCCCRGGGRMGGRRCGSSGSGRMTC